MNDTKFEQSHINDQIKLISTKNFIKITNDIENIVNMMYKQDQEALLKIIIDRLVVNQNKADILDGFIFQKLFKTNKKVIKHKLNHSFPNGITKLESSLKMNYQNLQHLLMDQQFKEADQFTSKHLCQLVEMKTGHKKEWLYFTDIQFLPSEDLFTIDLLWKIYSKGKFGFSVQKKIWLNSNKKWERLWEKIGWIKDGNAKRYPYEFTWKLEAPEGHLPLSNQLRGTKTLLYLFNSITWD